MANNLSMLISDSVADCSDMNAIISFEFLLSCSIRTLEEKGGGGFDQLHSI